jgi:hypothetical protein
LREKGRMNNERRSIATPRRASVGRGQPQNKKKNRIFHLQKIVT